MVWLHSCTCVESIIVKVEWCNKCVSYLMSSLVRLHRLCSVVSCLCQCPVAPFVAKSHPQLRPFVHRSLFGSHPSPASMCKVHEIAVEFTVLMHDLAVHKLQILYFKLTPYTPLTKVTTLGILYSQKHWWESNWQWPPTLSLTIARILAD